MMHSVLVIPNKLLWRCSALRNSFQSSLCPSSKVLRGSGSIVRGGKICPTYAQGSPEPKITKFYLVLGFFETFEFFFFLLWTSTSDNIDVPIMSSGSTRTHKNIFNWSGPLFLSDAWLWIKKN